MPHEVFISHSSHSTTDEQRVQAWLRESAVHLERHFARLRLRDELQTVVQWLWRETYKPPSKQDALGIQLARKFIAETRAELNGRSS